MPAIKQIQEISQKFIDVTPGRSTQYGEGVKKPKKNWAQSTEAAEAAFEEGIAQAIARKAFSKGVKEAGDEKYQKGVREKGVSRWPVGVRLSQKAYADGFGPYRDEIERTTLPQRYARRDPRNLERVSAISSALGRLKEASA